MSEKFTIKQGHCYLADMNPPRRSKPGKIRPVVVVQSQDTIDAGTSGIVSVPLTSRLLPENALRIRVMPSPELRLKKASDALADQMHTLDRVYFIEDLGEVPAEPFRKIRDGVKFLLDY